jgi:hypothetical protein
VTAFRHRMPGTSIESAPGARCRLCRGTEHLIHGEGVVVCRVCLMAVGEAAGFPTKAKPVAIDALAELHHDVVTLLRIATRDQDAELAWEWTAAWPGATDLRLLWGGTA